jgi:tight adherence protein B
MAEAPGHGALAQLAALWQVADSTGAGLAEGLDRLADELDAEVELRREIDTVLAGPRASARLMAVLPLGGLLLGAGLGGDPVGFLLHDPLGAACLLAGVGLVVTGLAWTRALARSAVA